MPHSNFSQGIGALKIARLVCLQKKIVVIIIKTRLKTSKRTPIASNPRHVPVPLPRDSSPVLQTCDLLSVSYKTCFHSIM